MKGARYDYMYHKKTQPCDLIGRYILSLSVGKLISTVWWGEEQGRCSRLPKAAVPGVARQRQEALHQRPTLSRHLQHHRSHTSHTPYAKHNYHQSISIRGTR